MTRSPDSLGALARSRAAQTYVVRASVQAVLTDFLAEDRPHRVLFVHGGAGSGKTAITQALGRLAPERDVRVVDGRTLTPDPEALDQALDGLGALPLVVVDTFERLVSLGPHLRERVVPDLPAAARVVIAGRVPPDPAWVTGPLGPLVRVVAMEPFDVDDAEAFLRLRGLGDPTLRAAIVRWADGLPLALALGATAGAITGRALNVDELDRTLLDHLTGEELAGADRDVLAVATIAPAVDARLLGAVLPGIDGPAAEQWVRSLSFAEPLGRGIALHDRVCKLVQAELKAHEPEYDRVLRLRIVDHLAERAVTSEPHLIADMQELVDSGVGAFVREALDTFQLDRVREHDFARAAELLAGPVMRPYLDRFLTWMRHAPEHVILVRRGEQLAGLALWATPRQLPDLPEPDVVLTAWTAYAAEHAGHDNVVFLPDLMFAAEPEHWLELLAIGNVAMLVRAGLTHLRTAYVGHDVPTQDEGPGGAAGQAAAFGGVPTPGLDVVSGDFQLRGYVIDYGPAGVVGATREYVHRMLQDPLTGPVLGESLLESLRRALRTFHRPLTLASNPLGVGATPVERVASVQSRLRLAVGSTFGTSADERLLRAIVEIGYLDPAGGHTVAMRRLHLSRTTYYRRLAEATARIAVTLDDPDGAPAVDERSTGSD